MTSNLDNSACTICGIIIITPTREDDIEEDPSLQYRDAWRGRAVALSGPAWGRREKTFQVSHDDLHCHTAEADGTRPMMMIEPSGPNFVPQQPYPANTDAHLQWHTGEHSFMSLHGACLGLAKQVMKTSRSASIRNMADLWVTLERRCSETYWTIHPSASFIPSIPENRRGEPLKLSLNRYYVPRNHIGGEQDDEEEDWWYYDPVNVPDLTSSLMSNLTHHIPETPTSTFKSRFDSLPQEIKDHIADFIPGQPLAASCNYLLPQSEWKRIFLKIPFLMDLDEQLVAQKSDDWDWEKLTRQVMTPVEMAVETGRRDVPYDFWSYEKAGLDVPLGFNNRRRVWQILEEMYPNDVASNEHAV